MLCFDFLLRLPSINEIFDEGGFFIFQTLLVSDQSVNWILITDH
jgi:hypothetical protein